MGDISVLPGVERRDINNEVASPDVLSKAIEAGCFDVIVVARDRSGEFYLAAQDGNADTVVGKLMRAVQFLTAHEFVHDKG